jgi:cyclopropane-fatty-acyl-phospholipid synthase
MPLRLRDRSGVLLHDGGSGPTVTILDERLWASVALDGSDGSGDAYAAGWWEADDLIAVARLFARERVRLRQIDGGLGSLMMPLHALGNLFRRNTRRGARKNIHRHYDLGNAFFSLWLDPTLTYSSAIWPRPDATLEEAQHHKLAQLFDRLDLQPGEHLVEIGSGWGGLAIEAARTRGVRVTTVTISTEQHRLATERVQAAGLADRVTVRLCDYRDLDGTYDKLVSVEMIEAVGSAFYGTFFKTCSRLLKSSGLAVLQAITIPDREFARAARESDFIKRRIFPGCCIPSLGALQAAASKHSDLDLVQHEDFAPHYAKTLALWLDQVRAIGPKLAELGYDHEFQRLWHFYLAYCSGGFAERALGVAHLTFAKPGWRRADQPWLAP